MDEGRQISLLGACHRIVLLPDIYGFRPSQGDQSRDQGRTASGAPNRQVLPPILQKEIRFETKKSLRLFAQQRSGAFPDPAESVVFSAIWNSGKSEEAKNGPVTLCRPVLILLAALFASICTGER